MTKLPNEKHQMFSAGLVVSYEGAAENGQFHIITVGTSGGLTESENS